MFLPVEKTNTDVIEKSKEALKRKKSILKFDQALSALEQFLKSAKKLEIESSATTVEAGLITEFEQQSLEQKVKVIEKFVNYLNTVTDTEDNKIKYLMLLELVNAFLRDQAAQADIEKMTAMLTSANELTDKTPELKRLAAMLLIFLVGTALPLACILPLVFNPASTFAVFIFLGAIITSVVGMGLILTALFGTSYAIDRLLWYKNQDTQLVHNLADAIHHNNYVKATAFFNFTSIEPLIENASATTVQPTI